MDLFLHSLHASLGATFEKASGIEFVASYGDFEKEYQAASQGIGLWDGSTRGLLKLTGPDRTSFLQGMCTQDLKPLEPGRATYAAFLTAKGAMVADARIYATDDALWLDVEPAVHSNLFSFLSKFLISEEAEIVDVSDEWAMVSLLGPLASSVSLPEGTLKLEGLLSGVDVFVPRHNLEKTFQFLLQQPGVIPVGTQARETLRIEKGIPRFGIDMTETTIPLEARLERAISYDKGCYIGQEIIARATFRGHMNKLLCGVLLGAHHVTNTPPPLLFSGDKKVGTLTSVTYSPLRKECIALGYIHRDFCEPGTQLTTAEGASASITTLPF